MCYGRLLLSFCISITCEISSHDFNQYNRLNTNILLTGEPIRRGWRTFEYGHVWASPEADEAGKQWCPTLDTQRAVRWFYSAVVFYIEKVSALSHSEIPNLRMSNIILVGLWSVSCSLARSNTAHPGNSRFVEKQLSDLKERIVRLGSKAKSAAEAFLSLCGTVSAPNSLCATRPDVVSAREVVTFMNVSLKYGVSRGRCHVEYVAITFCVHFPSPELLGCKRRARWLLIYQMMYGVLVRWEKIGPISQRIILS